jgi:RNA polymerase sigma-70 factor (ECF subfamily)
MALPDNPKLFETYLAPVLKPAYGVAYYLTQNGEEAEALVREAALRTFLSFSLYQPGKDFTVRFMKTLTELFFEKSGPEIRRSLPETWDDLPDTGVPDVTPEDGAQSLRNRSSAALFASLTDQQIAGAFAQLPEGMRLIVTLYFMEELSYQQIADILGYPLVKVRTCLHRGRWVLQRLLCSIAQTRSNAAASPMHRAPV